MNARCCTLLGAVVELPLPPHDDTARTVRRSENKDGNALQTFASQNIMI